MDTSLTDIFNDFAARLIADFPEFDGKFFLYSAPTETLHGNVPAQDKDKIIEREKSARRLQNGEQPYAYAGNEGGYDFIHYIETDSERRNYTTYGDPHAREIFSQLWHEEGHLVVPGAAANIRRADITPVYKECAAEAYAFLRQAQEYGPIRAQVERAAYKQALLLIQKNDTSHFTVPVLMAVARLAEQEDLTRLTPRETAQLAQDIANAYTPTNAELLQLRSAFHPAYLSYSKKQERWEEPMFRKIAEAEPSNGLVNVAARALLTPFLHARTDIVSADLFSREEMKKKFSGAYWNGARKRFSQKAKPGFSPP